MAPSSSSSINAPIPLPASLTAHTPAIPPSSQAALLNHLRATGTIGDLQTLLQDTLARSGWTDRVRALALELLRNGTCDTFPELMNEVLRRARLPKAADLETTTGGRNGGAANGTTSASTPSGTPKAGVNGAGTAINGSAAITVSREWCGPDGLPEARIPESAVDAGVVFLKERIRDVVEVVHSDDESD